VLELQPSSTEDRCTIYTSLTGEQIGQVKEMRKKLDRSYASLVRIALAHYYENVYLTPVE
jgi:hypothetical protein